MSTNNSKVTVIIPFNKDRGWLKDAVKSVPKDVQLILSKGDGTWPQNFNKALPEAEGEFIKYLHEDDMLTFNCIEDSVETLINTGADFIHGRAIEIYEGRIGHKVFISSIPKPTLADLLWKNTIHSATLMYRKSVFDRIGGFNESSEVDSFEEYEFNLRCLQAGMKIEYCPKPLAIYRRHSLQKIRIATANNVKRNDRIKRKELLKAKFI
jgi:GT2 family glycosyltransferase